MCDTIGKLKCKCGCAIFAKNSDRQFDEPQVMVYVDAKEHTETTLKTTYISIEQVKHTHAVLLSKPIWMWGAEMGVNDCGVCIGNEALYTKTAKDNEQALIGMDFVRLGLERSSSAKQAVDVIIDLLQKYGQGGNCGYNKQSYYDNSFLVMDRYELYIVETVGKNYAVKQRKMASISNCVSITKADRYNIFKNFKKKYFDKSKKSAIYRQKQTYKKLKNSNNAEDFCDILKTHSSKGGSFNICMHGECQTTNSMVVVLHNKPEIYFTGCPNPCKSQFIKYVFGEKLIYPIVTEENKNDCTFWKSKR